MIFKVTHCPICKSYKLRKSVYRYTYCTQYDIDDETKSHFLFSENKETCYIYFMEGISTFIKVFDEKSYLINDEITYIGKCTVLDDSKVEEYLTLLAGIELFQ